MADLERRQMPGEIPKSFDVREAVAVWKRRGRLATLVFGGLFATIASLTLFLPSLYRATATLIAEGQQVPEALVRSTVTSAIDTRVQTMTRQILTWSRLGDLIVQLQLYPRLRKIAPPEAVVEEMGRDIELQRKAEASFRGSTVFTLSYQARNPETAAMVANTLAAHYVEENLRGRELQATGTAQFLKVQLDDRKQQLAEQERRLSDFKKRYIGELPQQMQANLTTLERLTTQLRLNTDTLIRTQERRDALKRLVAEAEILEVPDPSAASNPAREVVDPAAERLARLQQQLTELRLRFSDKYPDVVQLRRDVATLERQRASRPRPVSQAAPRVTRPADSYVLQLRQSLDQVDTELNTLKDEQNRLRNDIATYQARVENAPRRDQELQEIARDYDTTTKLYQNLLSRYEEAQLAESLEQRQKGEQFRILEAATTPLVPSSPRTMRLLLVGFLLSAGCAVGSVILAEHLDTSVHRADDLRALAPFPVLVSIPRIVTEADARRQTVRTRVVMLSAGLGLGLIVAVGHHVASENEQLVRLLAMFRS